MCAWAPPDFPFFSAEVLSVQERQAHKAHQRVKITWRICWSGIPLEFCCSPVASHWQPKAWIWRKLAAGAQRLSTEIILKWVKQMQMFNHRNTCAHISQFVRGACVPFQFTVSSVQKFLHTTELASLTLANTRKAINAANLEILSI